MFLFLYAAPLIGLPELVAGSRLCSTIHLLLLAVAVMPLDFVFSFLASYFAAGIKARHLLFHNGGNAFIARQYNGG